MSTNVIAHHGIKGQRWGVRRFQNYDGTLTKAGVEKYSREQYRKEEKAAGSSNPKSSAKERYKNSSIEDNISAAKKFLKENGLGIDSTSSETIKANTKRKVALGVGSAVITSAAVVGLAAAGHAFVKKTMVDYLGKMW